MVVVGEMVSRHQGWVGGCIRKCGYSTKQKVDDYRILKFETLS